MTDTDAPNTSGPDAQLAEIERILNTSGRACRDKPVGPNALFDFLESPEGAEPLDHIMHGEVSFASLKRIADRFQVLPFLLWRICCRITPPVHGL